MSALPLFDLFLSLDQSGAGSDDPADADRIARWSGQLVEEALAEVGHIREMDEDLGEPAEHSGFNRQAAILLQGAYEGWSRRAISGKGMVAMSFQFEVRVGLGNGTREQTVRVTANNANDARRAAEGQTGGKALGQYQVSSPKPKK